MNIKLLFPNHFIEILEKTPIPQKSDEFLRMAYILEITINKICVHINETIFHKVEFISIKIIFFSIKTNMYNL